MDNKKSTYEKGQKISLAVAVIGFICLIVKLKIIGFYLDGSDAPIIILIFIVAIAGIVASAYFNNQLKKIKEKEDNDRMNS